MAHGSNRVDPARLVAAEVLIEVEEQGRFANLVLPKALRAEQTKNRKFDYRDAAFTSELTYGTIRQQGFLDFALAKHSSKPLVDLDTPVLVCLRMGAYQLLFMRVADHAALSETVEIARKLTGEGPSKFVNAILRSLLREGKEAVFERGALIGDEQTRLSTVHSHPGWIVSAIGDALVARGLPRTDLPEALEANNQAPHVTLVARPGLISPGALAQEVEDVLGVGTRQGMLSEFAVVLDSGGDPGALPSVRGGQAAVQDEGSQLAAILLAEAPLDGPDQNWLDLCAGPGGKSALLATLGADRGVQLVANEVNPLRARLVQRSVQAVDNVTVTNSDGRKLQVDQQFDRVLVDAPCLGLGSLRRRPESRWRHHQSDLDELVPLQKELLEAGIRLARPGGVIAWVTCSPHTAETLAQVNEAIATGLVELLDASKLAQEMVPEDLGLGGGDETASKTVQLWPHRHGSDAMFIALLRRN
ncbi:RsmB/NOP family class I SAM-dependent RNA methyltransferase [Actinomyces minihominis]|uniref:RsmB/NOP family class I SAM-dependent RNA methyltransferase n=1 Tax=Actinomyces minihominis TaxID=2002838 RepID=UPI000C07C8E5|nr:transcription antitermination factor NusB [Actinomyces minihominis]